MNIEDAIQKELIRWIRETYPEAKVIATRNEENRRRPHEIENGMPDLLIRWKRDNIRHFLYFEVKTKKGRLSPDQKEWAALPRLSNEHYGIGYGLIQCKEVITMILASHYEGAIEILET